MTTLTDDTDRSQVGQHRSGPPRRQVVTAFAPKGGSGTTAFATNLAAALHSLDQRVCLVDLDLEFGDVGVALRLDPVHSIADAIDAPPTADGVVDLLTEYRPGFDCVLAPIDPASADDLPSSLVARMLEQLRPKYDFVVVDTHERFSDHVLAAIDASDHLLVIANPEITSLKNVRICLDVLDLLDHPAAARQLVLQKDGLPSGMTAAEVSGALNLELAATIPWDAKVTASINDGTPLVVSDPGHAVSAAVRDFAVRALVPDVAGTTKTRRRARRFGRKS